MSNFTFDTPRLNCLPITDVNSDEFFKLVKDSGVSQQRSCFSNPAKLLDKVSRNGYVAVGAFLKDYSRMSAGCPQTLIGCICGAPLDRYFVLDFIVSDKYRKQGFGTELLNAFVQKCRSERCVSNFRVQVEKNNLSAISFLDSMGFSVYPGGDFTVIVGNKTQYFHTYRARFKEVCA